MAKNGVNNRQQRYEARRLASRNLAQITAASQGMPDGVIGWGINMKAGENREPLRVHKNVPEREGQAYRYREQGSTAS